MSSTEQRKPVRLSTFRPLLPKPLAPKRASSGCSSIHVHTKSVLQIGRHRSPIKLKNDVLKPRTHADKKSNTEKAVLEPGIPISPLSPTFPPTPKVAPQNMSGKITKIASVPPRAVERLSPELLTPPLSLDSSTINPSCISISPVRTSKESELGDFGMFENPLPVPELCSADDLDTLELWSSNAAVSEEFSSQELDKFSMYYFTHPDSVSVASVPPFPEAGQGDDLEFETFLASSTEIV